MLSLAKYAQVQFQFLIDDYGFKSIVLNENHVRYLNETVVLDICYDSARSYEIDIAIGLNKTLRNAPSRNFNLREILDFKKAAKKEWYTGFQASKQQDLIEVIRRLACLIKTYAVELLQGNQFVFNALLNASEKQAKTLASERKLQAIRKKVFEAWQLRNYKEIVELLSPVENLITPGEKKKLVYAKKHLRK